MITTFDKATSANIVNVAMHVHQTNTYSVVFNNLAFL